MEQIGPEIRESTRHAHGICRGCGSRDHRRVVGRRNDGCEVHTEHRLFVFVGLFIVSADADPMTVMRCDIGDGHSVLGAYVHDLVAANPSAINFDELQTTTHNNCSAMFNNMLSVNIMKHEKEKSQLKEARRVLKIKRLRECGG
jgi:hypothetical protein